MPYVTQAQIEDAKKMDLLTYLQTYEPDELMHFSGDFYTTRSHDSLKISNGKWCWWSRGIGGRAALDYLIKARGMALPEAVLRINGQAMVLPPVSSTCHIEDVLKKLILPERNANNDRAIAYLTRRGIRRSIIDYCIRTGRLYESQEHHNVVFIGFDREDVPRYGMFRGTTGSRYIGEATGSDKRYSFSIPSGDESTRLHLFESAIDLLSFCTLEMLAGRDWRQDHCISLAGVYMPKKNMEESAPPAALMQCLKDYPKIDAVSLHLDNDAPGRLAAEAITVKLKSSYAIKDSPPPEGKDYLSYNSDK